MVKHIFKIIWNDRKSNLWLLVEYVMVFTILWFCTDILYTMARSYSADTGYDITGTYEIRMLEKPESIQAEEHGGEIPDYDRVALLETFLDRTSRHPDVQAVALSQYSMPHTLNTSSSGFSVDGDSLSHNLMQFSTNSGYFDVFGIEPVKGRIFDSNDPADRNLVVISPRNARGDFTSNYHVDFVIHDASSVRRIGHYSGDQFDVVGVVPALRRNYFRPYMAAITFPLDKSRFDLRRDEIAIKVKPGREEGFRERFMADMFDQLQIGPYFLADVTPFSQLGENSARVMGVPSRIKSVWAVTAFLVLNIFFGILGTFWFRTQSRRSEIGLRMAMGSTRKKIVLLFAGETLCLLAVAAVIGTVICLNINGDNISDMILEMDMNRYMWGISGWQDLLNFTVTFLFLALVSFTAVWYPARQAAATRPAEVLHEE